MPVSSAQDVSRPQLQVLYDQFGQLGLEMAKAQRLFTAPLNIGATRELFVSAFLRRHLPKTVWVGRGEIIDADGQRSGDCDVVVYRSSSPVIPVDSGETLFLFFAEGVDSVIEVKSNLTGDELADCVDNSRRIKSLRTGSRLGGEPGFPDIAVVPEGYSAEPLAWIRYFVIAFDGIADERITRQLGEAYPDGRDYYRYGVDGICILNRSYIYKNDGLVWPNDSELGRDRAARLMLVRNRDDLLALFLHLTTATMFTVQKVVHFADYLQRGAR